LKNKQMSTATKGTALITGASSGIGAVYADRLACSGYDLILVARTRHQLDTIASRAGRDTGRSVKVTVADLNHPADPGCVRDVLRTGENITMPVNNAEIGDVAPLEMARQVMALTLYLGWPAPRYGVAR
jgi:short-subunit dehydrogenase